MSILDDKKIYAVDQSDMYHKIIHLPDQIRTAYLSTVIHLPENLDLINNKLTITKPIRRVIIAGMGGSAIAGDLIKTGFSYKNCFEVCKDYDIPSVTSNDLLIICSYSGNTSEAISCYKLGAEKAAYTALISSGGRLKDLIEKRHLWCELPEGYPPRAAIGYLFFSLLRVLEKFDIIPRREGDVRCTISTLMQKAGALAGNVMTEFNITKQAAISINKKIPVIYAGNPTLTPVAYRMKCQINENAKYPAFYHTLPEMNHNEIEAWEHKQYSKIFIPVFLSDIDEDLKYKRHLKFMRDLFMKEGIEYLDFYAEGTNYIEKTFSLIYLADMISYYLAILRNVDPTKIDYIERLKKALS